MRKHTAPGMEGPSGPSRGVRLNQRPRRTTRSPVSALHTGRGRGGQGTEGDTATPQLRSLCALSPERPAGLLWRGATQTAGLGTDTRRAPKGRETGASRPLQPSRGLGFGGSRSCCLGTPATRGDQGSVCSQPPKQRDRWTADGWPQTDSAGGSPAGPGPAPHAGRAPRGRAAVDGAPVPPVRGAGGSASSLCRPASRSGGRAGSLKKTGIRANEGGRGQRWGLHGTQAGGLAASTAPRTVPSPSRQRPGSFRRKPGRPLGTPALGYREHRFSWRE